MSIIELKLYVDDEYRENVLKSSNIEDIIKELVENKQ